MGHLHDKHELHLVVKARSKRSDHVGVRQPACHQGDRSEREREKGRKQIQREGEREGQDDTERERGVAGVGRGEGGQRE